MLGRPHAPFSFDAADIKVVVAEVARRTITVIAAGDVMPAQALELLRSALALHGYAIVSRPEGMWIVRAHDIARSEFIVQVVPHVVIGGDSAAVEQMRRARDGKTFADYGGEVHTFSSSSLTLCTALSKVIS